MPKRVVKRRVRRRPAPPAPTPGRSHRRAAPLTVLLALVAAGAVVAAVLVTGRGGGSTVQVSERTATVTRGVIQTIVSGSGNLEPFAQQDVDFATSGTVTEIYVHAGERIDKGDLIARVDSSTQRVAVDKAAADLADAEDALTKAETAAATATATPQTTAATATATTVAVAAQATPSPTGTPARPTPTPTATPAHTPTAGATAAPAQSTQSGGGSTQSVASAEANVESDQLALKQAQDDLDATELRAPMSGTVAAVNGAVGDTTGGNGSSSANAASSSESDAAASSGSGFVVLADLKTLKMEVSLSESDIAKVHKGQSATVTINAASGEKVAAHVTSVGVLASSSSSGSGAVSYPVDVTLDQTTQGVKAGMSATADIVVAQASGLMVPSQALRGSALTVVRDGKRSTQQVETGVVGDSDTQVLNGVQAGDQVIVTSTTATLGAAASRAAGNSGAPGGFRGFGGTTGGFVPGAGFGGGARFRAAGG